MYTSSYKQLENDNLSIILPAHWEFVVNTSLVEEDSPEITDLSGNDIVLDKKRNHSEKNTYIPNFNNCGN